MPKTFALQQNHLLAALSTDARNRLLPYLEWVALKPGEALHEAGTASRHVYFPTDSIVALHNATLGGELAVISLVGNEGLVGIASYMGGGSSLSRASVLCAGHAFRLQEQRLRNEFNHHGELQHLLLRYAQALMTQVAQTAVCNRLHSINQQLCRLLLSVLDRSPSSHLTMTHEIIANMLGVRREGVTCAAGKLQKLGAIGYCRGHITVLDRPTLETMCCECYAVVRKETQRLLPNMHSCTRQIGHMSAL